MFSYSFTLTSWKKKNTVTERERPQYLVDIGAHTEVGEEKEKEIQEKVRLNKLDSLLRFS